MFSFLDLMTYKPTNPSSKHDIIQDTHEHIDDAINHTNHQIDERFHEASQNLKQQ